MSAGDGKVTYYVRIDDKYVEADMTAAGNAVESNSSKISAGIGKAALAIGSAVAAAGAASIKLGTDFESSMAMASTLFGDVAVDTENLNDKILALSDVSGIAATDLGDTLYQAMSAGVEVTEDMGVAMDFLEKSTKLATGSGAELVNVVDTQTSIMNAYKMESEDLDKVQKILLQTQNKGKTTVQELGASLSQVTPTAAAMGMEFEQVGASLAVMTANGVPTAQATTKLNALLLEMGKDGTQAAEALELASAAGQLQHKSFEKLVASGIPADELIKAFGKDITEFNGDLDESLNQEDIAKGLKYLTDNGILATKSFQELMDEGVPLNEILDMMGSYANETGLQLTDMFSSSEAGAAALLLSGQNAEAYTDALAAMSTEADVVTDAFDAMSETTDQKFTRLTNSLKNMGIELFTQLEPVISELLPVLKDNIGPLLEPLMQLVTDIMPILSETLDTIIPPLSELAGELFPVLAQVLEVVIEPLLKIVDEVFPVLAELLDVLLDPLSEILYMLGPVFEEALNVLLPLLTDLITSIMPELTRLFDAIIPVIKVLLDQILPILIRYWDDVFEVAGSIIDEILPVLIDLFEKLMPPLMELIERVLPPLTELFFSLIEPLLDLIVDLLPPITQMLDALIPVFVALVEAITPVLEIIIALAQSLLDKLMPVITTVAEILVSALGGAFESVSGVVTDLLEVFTGIISFFQNIFKGDWEAAWEDIKGIFSNFASALGGIIKAPINAIIGAINGVIRGLNGLKIPDWVPIVGGKTLNLKTIPSLRVGLDYVPNEDFPAVLHRGEAVLTAEEANLWRGMGGMTGLISALSAPDSGGIDYGELARAIWEAAPDMGHDIYLDVDKVGKTLEPSISGIQSSKVTVRGRAR